MAAINAAGYDADLSSPNNHPLRMDIRKALAAKKIDCLPELKEFFVRHRKRNDVEELSQYLSFALAVDGSPDFSFKTRSVEIPPDAAVLQELGPLLVRFSREANIEDLWQRSQPAIDQYLERYHDPVVQAVLQVNGYLRNVTSGSANRLFQVYVDLLAAPNQIQTRSYGNEYYVVITPSPEPRIHDIRHAYLHYLLDPLATKYAEVVMRKRGLADHAQRAGALPEAFKSDFLLLTTESLIKAVECRLDHKPELAQQALLEGYILTPYFTEQLPVYEKQEQAMSFYFPEMVKAIELKREDERLSKVEFLATAPVRAAKVAPPPPEPELTGAAKTLEEAEKLYSSRDLEKARESYRKVLDETSEQNLHAKAYYGLARIAVLQKDPELGEQLFKKVLECSPDPYVKAWTDVYLGRLAYAAGERQQAAQYYRDALAVNGASVAARRAAEQGLKENK